MVILLIVQTLLYALVILGLILMLRKLAVRNAEFIGFILFGTVTGVLAAWIWPLDSVTYPNVYGVLVGDQLYGVATAYFGVDHPSQAHLAVPWPLRVPQIYVFSSILIWGVLGLLVQYYVGWRRQRLVS